MLSFDNHKLTTALPPLVDLPTPIIIDMLPEQYQFPNLVPMLLAVAVKTGTMVIIDWKQYALLGPDEREASSPISSFISAMHSAAAAGYSATVASHRNRRK